MMGDICSRETRQAAPGRVNLSLIGKKRQAAPAVTPSYERRSAWREWHHAKSVQSSFPMTQVAIATKI